MHRSILTAALGSALSVVTTIASAVTELRYATAAPENTPWGAYLKKTVAAAEKAAEGELKTISTSVRTSVTSRRCYVRPYAVVSISPDSPTPQHR